MLHLEPIVRVAARLPIARLALLLDRERNDFIFEVLRRHEALVHGLQADLEGPYNATAVQRIEQSTTALLMELRRAGRRRWLTLTDALLRLHGWEFIDRAWYPNACKRFEMAILDRLNYRLGHYERWRQILLTTLGPRPQALVYDLGAGTGGFARYVLRQAGSENLRLVATDIDPAFASDVPFELCDVGDLRALYGEVELFVCTQATHHFSPGLVVRMISQAIRAAPLGILVIDLMRGALVTLGAGVVGFLAAPLFPPTAVDAMGSVRRGYTPAEMRLLALLAGATDVEARYDPPAHVVMRAWRR